MVKIENINQISDHFEDVVRDCIQQIYADWLKDHYSKLWTLQSILDELKVYLPTNGDRQNLPEELWLEVQKKFEKIISWSESIKYTSEELSLKSLSNTWQKGFNDVLYNLPDILKLEIRPSILQPQPTDKKGVKFRKKIYRVIKNFPLNIYGSKNNIRKIDLHNFLIHYLEVPVTNSILKLWQDYLNEVTKQYQDIFDKISELKEKVLFIDKLKNLQDPFEKFDFFEKIFSIAEILNQTDIILQSMRERENYTQKFVDEEWKKISDITEFCWQYAGTYILPNGKYRTEVLSYNKKIAEKNFKKTATHWREQFAAIRANWTKNLEIYSLQLHIIEEFRKYSKNITVNKEVILNPAFENVLSLIETEEKKYSSKLNANGFIQKITSTQNEFYSNFKNHSIPQLVDSIYQTQMTESLEHFIQEITFLNHKASETHKIIRFHKNGSILPKSKTYFIPFHQLIEKEIIKANDAQYYDQIKETKNRLKNIIHSITEIKHLFELNWDSANNLVKSGKNNGEYNEALSIVKNAFKRSQEIIKKTWQESKDSLNFSHEILLNTSQQLYKDYQSLTNVDQLLEYYHKYKRDKSQIHIQVVIKKLLSFFKYIFTDLIKGAFTKIKSAIKKGDIESIKNVEEILTQTDRSLKEHLANIPTVYERLFQSKSEINTRFYFERNYLTEQIKTSFQKWETGENVLTVILGENGNGKTSSLNFVANNLFKNQNIIRVNLTSFCSSEEVIISLLQNSFNLKNVKTWEKLLQKIGKLSVKPIVVFDNLHYLFKKTPGGFQILENFLLFLQQTQQSIYWLFSCSEYNWLILDKVLDISRVINQKVHLKKFTAEEIQNIIFDRHKISGHKIIYETGETEKQNGQHKKLKIDNRLQNHLENKFFNKLGIISQGNISIAFLYWLNSIKEFSENKIYIRPVSSIQQKVFNQINDDDLLFLTPFFDLKYLNAMEISAINRQLNHQTLIALNRLASWGLLENKNGIFSLNMFFYLQLKDTLLSKKYLQKHNHDSEGTNNKVTINLYLPVITNTISARKIALQSAALSKYVDLNSVISINFSNQIFDGVSVYNLKIECGIIDIKFNEMLISEVSEMILSELLKQGIISQNDFYN